MSFTDFLGNEVNEGDYVAFCVRNRMKVGRFVKLHSSGRVTVLSLAPDNSRLVDIRTGKTLSHWWSHDHYEVPPNFSNDYKGTHKWYVEKRQFHSRNVVPDKERLLKIPAELAFKQANAT